jgi:predicted DNA-binding transcriptional regulator YafY
MSKAGYFQRYLLIVRKIKNNRFISLNELINIVEKEITIYEDTDSLGLSKRTIQRDFDDIRDIFKIDIMYSKSNNGYYILEDEWSDIERQLEYFDLIGTLDSELEKFVFAEKRKSKGTEYLYPLISAIKSSRIVEFRYRKFDNTVTKEKRIVQPYAIKEFKNRWYLLAIEIDGRLDERGQIKTWGLDRIENFYTTNKLFDKNIHIDIEVEFKNCFGIHSDEDQNVEEVILSFTSISGKYNEALPLHNSQETLIDNEKEFRIKLKVKITYDFIMELLSQSENLKVIAPLHLKETLIRIHEKAIDL